jgi:hypothetical protein
MVGPARPAGTLDTAPHRVISPRDTSSAHAGIPLPYQRSGHDGTAHPAATRRSLHARSESDGSQLLVTHARTSARRDSSVNRVEELAVLLEH